MLEKHKFTCNLIFTFNHNLNISHATTLPLPLSNPAVT